MSQSYRHGRPTIGTLAGWQYYWTATSLSYLNPIYRGICLAAHDLGCNLLLGCGVGPSASSSDPLRPVWPVPSSDSDFVPIGPWNADGLIVFNPLHSHARSSYLQELIARGYPVMFVASGENGPAIVADNEGGIFAAVQHLVEHGHRRIAFIAGSPDDLKGDTGARLSAYRSSVQEFGLADDERLVVYGRHVHDAGCAAMQQVIDSGVDFTAVLASNDESALGAMQALRDSGRRVPHDVAIIGFDDRPESVVQEPPLSSVHVPLFKMGYRAVELLLERIAGRAEPGERFKIPTHLVIRESCGCGGSRMPLPVPKTNDSSLGMVRPAGGRSRLAQEMATSILNEAQDLSRDEVHTACLSQIRALIASVDEDDPSRFQRVLEDILRRVESERDDTHIWQGAISILSTRLSDLLPAPEQSAARDLARGILGQAHVTISAAMRRQYRSYVAHQRWTVDRISVLTPRLLTALDETQVYQVLARHLPAMGVQAASVALFEAEDDDQVAWSILHGIIAPAGKVVRFRTRDFPPDGFLPDGQPFSLALLPLVSQRGQLGMVAFHTEHLDLYGAIAQQLAAALNTAQLYREATEGRQLAEEANQMKGRFLSTVSHELRTPLNLIVGLSAILLQESDQGDVPLPEPYRQDVERIQANAQHLSWLIGDVLDLASSDAGQLRLANELLDLSEVLRVVADTGRQLAEAKGLAWRSDLPASGPWVWGDRTRLRQIALNLIHNAVKFTGRGEVCLEIDVGNESVTVAVCDTGMGIPLADQALIFREFGRSERSVTLGYGGLGLGLAICQRLVAMHGGTIGVQSSGENGQGSTFYFTLPIIAAPVRAEDSALAALAARGVVLLTEQLDGGDGLRTHLAKRDIDLRVVRVDESPDWLAQAMEWQPGAVLLDASIAPSRGWQVLKALKGSPAMHDAAVMFCSLSSDRGSILELDCLSKPIGLADLTHALDGHWPVSDSRGTPKTVLVVDDDPETVAMHARIVRAHSRTHRVLKARDGREALDILQHERVDLLLLDLLMPEVDGFGVLEAMQAKEATRGIPVIVLTGQTLTERDVARLNQGVARLLSKGMFGIEETLAHVDAALECRRSMSKDAQRLVRRAMAYLHEHYADDISRQDLAHHVGLDDDYLTSCFRKELGMTPIAYLNRYRVNQAKRLLTCTSKSITEIALEVGFSDSGYFSRVFRREVGMSPEPFRRK